MTDRANVTTPQLSFRPFDERAPVRFYRHAFLPHLRQKACTYFVTFRLADSIPKSVLREWRESRLKWLGSRGIDICAEGWDLKFQSLTDMERSAFERSYAVKLFERLDEGHGECYLIAPRIAKQVVSSLQFFDGDRFELGDWCVMPNHVHALVTPQEGYELEEILHSVKSYSSNQINQLLRRSGPLWMSETYDRLVRDPEELLRTQDYIRANPTKAGLSPGQYSLGMASYHLV